ncbi:hypothetical protein DFA_08030 [Cavenderia fasciculata]|uniref:Uncharacterized protein n=1 Tax=Cavenderia fasciculata TaxID=261658 RepID=F4Q4P0_CACFS|nr:uncharacterized protein DFA_08030 [Cavenderia fasciculata]EGG17049.1 hypothetical protein DFA_08030 [Cavenderia fasciculata]|eukprot:XP_004355533.1 hypothetical protein DFA_08030 [Cavenderia fasciculata]
MTDILSILLSLSKDKYKDIIGVGLKSILSRSYIQMYEIIPNNPHKRIESFYNSAIDRIANVYHQIETTHSITDDQDLRELANLAEKNDKLCRILAKREVVMTLLRIIVNGEELWKQNYYSRLPLTEETIYQIYTTLDNDSFILDCTDLLNHILPWVKVQDIPYEGIFYVIKNHPMSPSSYRLTCTILRTMTLNRETIVPFISVGMIRMVRFFLANQVSYEYSQLQDYWLQITRIMYKDREYYFKSLSTQDQLYIEESYKNGRFKLWILPTKELRISPFSVMTEIISDGIGYYQGWINGTALFMDHIYSDSPISDMIYRRLDSTLTRYLASSLYASSLLLYFTVFLSRKGLIFYTLSTGLSMSIHTYQDKLVNHQKLSGPIYRAFQKYYQTDHHPGSSITMNMDIDQLNQNNIIKDKSDILNYRFK